MSPSCGAAISALYPVVEVVFQDQSIGQYLDVQVKRGEGDIAEIGTRSVDVPPSGRALRPSGVRPPAASIRSTRASTPRRPRSVRYRWAQPYAERIFPDDPFRTLALIVGFILVGTVLKGFFMFLGSLLVDRLALLATFDLRKRFYRRTLRMDLARVQREQHRRTCWLASRTTWTAWPAGFKRSLAAPFASR